MQADMVFLIIDIHLKSFNNNNIYMDLFNMLLF